jgi:hypothetical protein
MTMPKITGFRTIDVRFPTSRGLDGSDMVLYLHVVAEMICNAKQLNNLHRMQLVAMSMTLQRAWVISHEALFVIHRFDG